jgi:Flp pilus assembly protein TadD
MSKRKRRKSEAAAEDLAAENAQGDLLAGASGLTEPSGGRDSEGPDGEAGDDVPVVAADEDAEAPADDGGSPELTEPEAVVAAPAESEAQAAESEPQPAEPETQPGEPTSLEPRQPVVFEMASEEVPESAAPPPAGEHLARAKELVRQGRVEEAMALYREILSRNPANLKARNNLGVLFDELGQRDFALEQFEAAEKIEPENIEVLNNLGSTLAAMGRYDAAERELRRALRIDPGSVPVRASLGILFFRRGVYQQAEIELRWVCEQAPEHGPAFFYRGEALNRLGRVDEAMDALERAIVLQPTNSKAFYTLGILYDRKHLTEEAGVMYRKARELTNA